MRNVDKEACRLHSFINCLEEDYRYDYISGVIITEYGIVRCYSQGMRGTFKFGLSCSASCSFAFGGLLHKWTVQRGLSKRSLAVMAGKMVREIVYGGNKS